MSGSERGRSDVEVEFHPLADIFPLMEGEEFAALAVDIKANGLLEPIVLYEDKILDGRNRYRACMALGIDLRIRRWEHMGIESNPAAYVISLNLARRHLTRKERRAFVAVLIENAPEASNNSIAKVARVDDKTVASVRRDLEARSEIPNVERRTDTKGRKQPSRKARHSSAGAAAAHDAAKTTLVNGAKHHIAEAEKYEAKATELGHTLDTETSAAIMKQTFAEMDAEPASIAETVKSAVEPEPERKLNKRQRRKAEGRRQDKLRQDAVWAVLTKHLHVRDIALVLAAVNEAPGGAEALWDKIDSDRYGGLTGFDDLSDLGIEPPPNWESWSDWHRRIHDDNGLIKLDEAA